LRRVGKSGSGLSLPNFYDFARLPSIFCDPSRSMVAPRQRERMNPSHRSSVLPKATVSVDDGLATT